MIIEIKTIFKKATGNQRLGHDMLLHEDIVFVTDRTFYAAISVRLSAFGGVATIFARFSVVRRGNFVFYL